MALGTQFEDVLTAARQGAEWALTLIYRDLNPRLLRYLRAEVGQEADDLASDIWIEVARALDRFTGDESGFRAWVFTIARRRAIDLRRRERRRRTDPAPSEDIEAGLPVREIEAAVVEAIASDAALAYLLEGLPSGQAEVVLLRIVGDLSVEQTATILEKKEGAVRALQHRALARMVRKLRSARALV